MIDKNPHSQEDYELSRIISVKDTMSSPGPVDIEIIADQGELAALAKRFDLVEISSLSANVRLAAIGPIATGAKDGDMSPDILAQVDFKANLTQTCSVTLEPISDEIEAHISQIFSPRWQSALADESEDSEEDGEFIEITDIDAIIDIIPDPPEPIINGKINIGEFIAEELAVRINPFPRKKGVEFEWVNDNLDDSDGSLNPFSALKALKGGLENANKPKK
ncbi:MAG: DUF177 domain-containing protein [Rhodospirillaceae bacterium]|nr:DUF177 domain-containing protein [Rhodospirillaceae bacterium]